MRGASSCGLGNKEIAWWACEKKFRSSLEVSTRVWFWTSYCLGLELEGSCRINIVIAIVFGHNQEGLVARYIACNELFYE